MVEDGVYIARALELAGAGIGRTFPNPVVGAVIVSESEIVGEGYHSRAGGSHAEIEAILAAGEKAVGSTMYLNLEPCCHYGRTPPCTDSILNAGISRVVCSIYDPDKRVRGEGIRTLRERGVSVDIGIMAEEALEINLPYIHKAITGKPFIELKLALSLDGKITMAKEKYLSCDRSREYVHYLRSSMEAIATGRGTIEKDDPLLDRRLYDKDLPAPLRMVFDSKLSFPAGHRWIESGEKLIIYCTGDADREKRAVLEEAGAEIAVLPADDGRVEISAWVRDVAKRPITSVLVEGGGQIATSLLREGAVDRLVLFHSPVISGNDCYTWFQDSTPPGWFKRGEFHLRCLERIEDDIMAVYDRRRIVGYIDIVKGEGL